MSDTIAPLGDVMPHPMGTPSGQETGNGSSRANGGRDDPHQKKANARKRTKTGCLTCRKRRIKCDEGRPTCNNCLKSKRHCEGYNQRVVFKNPFRAQAHPLNGTFNHLGFLPNHGHHLEQFGPLAGSLAGPLAGPLAEPFPGPLPGRTGNGVLPHLAPKPPSLEYIAMPHGQQHGVHYLPPANHTAILPAAARSVYTPHGFQESSTSPLAPAMLPNYGSFDAFTPLGSQTQFDHSHVGLHARAADLEMYRDADSRIDAHMTVAYQDRASALPTRANLSLTNTDMEDGVEWDEDSDDEHESSLAVVAPVVNRLYTPGMRDTSMGTFNEFATSYAVSEYMSAPGLSELKDSAKRDIFEHFMRVTGPSMSLYERHPFDESEQQVTDSIPGSGTNIWSYTFPVMAFQHSGLLNAILASASLQMATVQGTPATAAMKHYSIALRRIAKCVRIPAKRRHPATLAATLLLGYYEVWNGDHNTWCNHLYGARILIDEMQLRDMSKRCLPRKVWKDRQIILKKMGLYESSAIPKDPNQLDFNFLSTLSGYHMHAADYGLTEDQILHAPQSGTTDRDLRDYDDVRDLVWWYCKMDVYQGILGGTPLFMEYGDWTECLPRAPFSRLDRIYGTYDHLILLIGRLVSFASKDLSRKRRDNRPAGGSMAGPSSPPWPGMIPTHGEFRAPMGFSPPKQNDPQPDPTEGMDAEASFKFALDEWEGISHAFAMFERNLGPEFQPLSSEFADRRDGPFGPALQYRTYSVAGIWMNYYMGLIHLHRSHPRMPPSAMPSVGLAASQTATYANHIGCIAVGLAEDFRNVEEVSTVMAAALIESAFCIFVAAVQYRDDSQRRWVVQRMLDITRLTGWQSARQIAEGCEAGWTKSAEMGLGPQYKRVAMPPADPETVWHNVRRIDRKIHEVDDRSDEKRLILARSERAHYALGLLGIEDDIEYLELQDHAFGREA